jgi:acyl carrier protein
MPREGNQIRFFGTSVQETKIRFCSRNVDMSVNEEVFSKVQSALVDALGVDDDEVTQEATMVGDLGAESIDFLDIVFKLEKAFGIKIQTEDLFPKDILTESSYVQDGKVNANGLAELKKRMPWANLSKFEANPRVQDFGDLLTVSDLCRYVQSKLA